jgi:hypothetical protein
MLPARERVRNYFNAPKPPSALPKTQFSPVFSTIGGRAPTYPDLALGGSLETSSFERYNVSRIFGLRLDGLRSEREGLALKLLLEAPKSAK